MAAPSITAIMDAIEAQLAANISGLRVDAYVKDNPQFPAALIAVPEIPNYHQAMQRGKFLATFQIFVITSGALDRIGQRQLASYADPNSSTSISQAIEKDRTLGGTVDDCYIKDFRPLGLKQVADVGGYGGVFQLEIVATGK